MQERPWRQKPAQRAVKPAKGSAQKKVDWKALEIVHPDAAGIDVGGSEHWVAISPDRDSEPVRRFGCFTVDLREMARWLIDKGVFSVALQSTGVYRMPVFEVLEQYGLEVFLVNAQHTKNVAGRKSDVQECQWLLKLRAFGLLNKSFQPSDEIRVARTLWRHRGDLVAEAGSAVQRMQKALTEMNAQLSYVLSDLSGVSGMNIIQAILEGERDPPALAALVMPGVKATAQDIAKSLEGNWRKELLFVLRQHLEVYRIYQEKIADCDLQLRKHLESLGSKVDGQSQALDPRPKGKKNRAECSAFDLRSELYRITGIDWAQINGIDALTAQTVVAEVGADLSAFASEKHFASWLGLCPTNEQSGGKILNRGTRKVVNRATVALRNAASQCRSDSAAQPELSGHTIPAPTHTAGRSQSDHRHGSKTSLPVLQADQTRTPIRGERNRILRIQVPRAADPIIDKTAQKLGLQVVIPQTA